MGRLNLDDIKDEYERETKSFGKGGSSFSDDIVWKCGKGTNRVRLATFTSQIKGKVMFCRAIKYHQLQNKEPVICGKSPDRFGNVGTVCEHCDHAQDVFEEEGKLAAGPLWSRDRLVFLVRPVEKANKEWRKADKLYQFWSAFTTVGKKIRGIILDADEVEDANDYFGTSGLDFKISFDRDAAPMDMYTVKVMPLVKSEDLDGAAFALADGMDLYAADNLEPYNWENPGTPEPEPEKKKPAKKPKAPPKRRAKTKVLPVHKEGRKYFSVKEAQQYLDYYEFDGWRVVAEDEDDKDSDGYYVSPDGETQWDDPVPTAEQAQKATGMKPATKKRKPQPQAETGEDAEDS